MKLCRFGIHKWTQWRTPRFHVQTRSCIYCGLYQRTLILVSVPGTIDDLEYPLTGNEDIDA